MFSKLHAILAVEAKSVIVIVFHIGACKDRHVLEVLNSMRICFIRLI